MQSFPPSELVLNPDNSVYHLNLKPGDVADTVILVGDKERVPVITNFFEKIEFKKEKREFITHTGYYKDKRITVLSTGIGTDNIDIVVNELDALVNIDLEKRVEKEQKKVLNLIRIGTCGSIQAGAPVNSAIVADYGLGFDNLMSFYKYRYNSIEKKLTRRLKRHLSRHHFKFPLYVAEGSPELRSVFVGDYIHGITITAPGFYGPQGRILRYKIPFPDFIYHMGTFNYKGQRVINFEMETSALYGLANILGHKAVTIDLVVANRVFNKFSSDYQEKMRSLIIKVLNTIAFTDWIQ
jgi:uridine phosphorylase